MPAVTTKFSKKIRKGFLSLITTPHDMGCFTSDPISEEYFMHFRQTHLTSAYPPWFSPFRVAVSIQFYKQNSECHFISYASKELDLVVDCWPDQGKDLTCWALNLIIWITFCNLTVSSHLLERHLVHLLNTKQKVASSKILSKRLIW